MYHPFIIPFSAGLVFLLLVVIIRFIAWFLRFDRIQKRNFIRGIFSLRFFKAFGEILAECLFHRRMYRVNKVLGYMHMSFAFGWLMLILVGNLETRLLSGPNFNPPYYPIFFKFFEREPLAWTYSALFNAVMDLLLIYILSGFTLAILKRIRSRIFGMKKTTRQRLADRFALTSLWLIFPLRYLAESFTSGVFGNGGFFTGASGEFFARFLPLEPLVNPAWWAYSLALGFFFVAVPFSRYMHIPTEIFLIAMRRFGLVPGPDYDVFSQVEVHACPRCGVCIDQCQISSAAGIHDIQTVYLVGDIRYGKPREDLVMNCLMCGRCKEFCPVGIHTDNLRLTQRVKLYNSTIRDFSYIPKTDTASAELVYFAGCMTHLTPGIRNAVTGILERAGVKFLFMDERESVCCGRPLMLAGELDSAKKLMWENQRRIQQTGAKILLTSCPICYKIFREEYHLGIQVLHHTQYFLHLIREGRIRLSTGAQRLVYHDPCDLGRGSGEYDAPREILRLGGQLLEPAYSGRSSVCCGGALGNLTLSAASREKITRNALDILLAPGPDALITACPLCKKTFTRSAACEVSDIAEWVNRNMEEMPVQGRVKVHEAPSKIREKV